VASQNRHQFVFTKPCGCPIGLVEGSYAKTEDGAWDKFADDLADERRLRDRGVTVDHVTPQRVRRAVLPAHGPALHPRRCVMTADDWNNKHHLGTLVTAYMGAPGELPLQTWNPGNGEPVVLVRGVVGSVRLSHIETREDDPS
jgi:hypothetical protein